MYFFSFLNRDNCQNHFKHYCLKISTLINMHDIAHESLKVLKMDLMVKCTDGFNCLFCYHHGNFKEDRLH